jgi:hypothetical protein
MQAGCLVVPSLLNERIVRVKELNGISGGLVAVVVATGVLMVPECGIAPLVGLLAAVATSVYIAGKLFRDR